MECCKRPFAVVSLLFAALLLLSIGTLNARDADPASRTIVAAQTAKQQCKKPVVHAIATVVVRTSCHRSSVGVFIRTAFNTLVLV